MGYGTVQSGKQVQKLGKKFASQFVTFETPTIKKVKQTLAVPGLEVSSFQDNWQMEVVRLSALRTGHFYPQGNDRGI
jgi:hypothetical protein